MFHRQNKQTKKNNIYIISTLSAYFVACRPYNSLYILNVFTFLEYMLPYLRNTDSSIFRTCSGSPYDFRIRGVPLYISKTFIFVSLSGPLLGKEIELSRRHLCSAYELNPQVWFSGKVPVLHRSQSSGGWFVYSCHFSSQPRHIWFTDKQQPARVFLVSLAAFANTQTVWSTSLR